MSAADMIKRIERDKKYEYAVIYGNGHESILHSECIGPLENDWEEVGNVD